jgi:hypothetical protein
MLHKMIFPVESPKNYGLGLAETVGVRLDMAVWRVNKVAKHAPRDRVWSSICWSAWAACVAL